MIALRWVLGIGSVAALAACVALFVLARSFRRSFGARPTTPLAFVAIVAGIAVLTAGVVWPSPPILLHCGAVAAVAGIGLCLTKVSPITLVGIAYCALWLVHYAVAAFPAAVPA